MKGESAKTGPGSQVFGMVDGKVRWEGQAEFFSHHAQRLHMGLKGIQLRQTLFNNLIVILTIILYTVIEWSIFPPFAKRVLYSNNVHYHVGLFIFSDTLPNLLFSNIYSFLPI